MKIYEDPNFSEFIWILTHEEKALVLLLAFGFTESELSGRFDFEVLSKRIEIKFMHFQKDVHVKSRSPIPRSVH